MTDWALLLEPHGRPGADNMAVDAALLARARAGSACLRLYRFDPPCLSFGRHEPATRRYDRAAIANRGLDTVRRPTGGRAVWHDLEVTYAVAAPLARFGSLAESYLAIHRMLAGALEALGLRATVAEPRGRPPAPGAGACFAAPVGGEILVEGRKAVGSAQVREGDALLQHGSILLVNRQDVVAALTTGGARAPAAIGIKEALGRDLTFDDVASAVCDAARRAWPGGWTTTDPPPPPDPNPFADPGWTWRR